MKIDFSEVESELIGLPSGQVLTFFNGYVTLLFKNGYIEYNTKLQAWTFNDDDLMKMQKFILLRQLYN
jgi:hypothetical protein